MRETEKEDVEVMDEKEYPRQEAKLVWQDMNQDFKSNPKSHKGEVEEIAQ